MLSNEKQIAIPGAIVDLPPPVKERISYVNPNVEAFSEQRKVMSLPVCERLKYHDISQTNSFLRRRLGEYAIRSMEAATKPLEFVSIIPALPRDAAKQATEEIIASPYAMIYDRVEAIEGLLIASRGGSREEVDAMAEQLVEDTLAHLPEGSKRSGVVAELASVVPPKDVLQYLEAFLEDTEPGVEMKFDVIQRVQRPDSDKDQEVYEKHRFELIRTTLEEVGKRDIFAANKAVRMLGSIAAAQQDELLPAAEKYAKETHQEFEELKRIYRSRGAKLDPSDEDNVWSLNNFNLFRSFMKSVGERQQGIMKDRKSASSILHDKATSKVEKFDKTGSKLYILPKEQEASVRVIRIASAGAWLHGHENLGVWHQSGFNYSPFEPILSIHPTEDPKEVAVVVTNLAGRSLAKIDPRYKKHTKQIITMKDRIHQGLDTVGITHGHPHLGNFVVVPYVDEEGIPNVSQCPRLYVIDFDEAKRY